MHGFLRTRRSERLARPYVLGTRRACAPRPSGSRQRECHYFCRSATLMIRENACTMLAGTSTERDSPRDTPTTRAEQWRAGPRCISLQSLESVIQKASPRSLRNRRPCAVGYPFSGVRILFIPFVSPGHGLPLRSRASVVVWRSGGEPAVPAIDLAIVVIPAPSAGCMEAGFDSDTDPEQTYTPGPAASGIAQHRRKPIAVILTGRENGIDPAARFGYNDSNAATGNLPVQREGGVTHRG